MDLSPQLDLHAEDANRSTVKMQALHAAAEVDRSMGEVQALHADEASKIMAKVQALHAQGEATPPDTW